MTNEILWYATRATAVTSVVLITGVVIMGCAVAVGRRRSAETGAVLARVHRSVSLLAALFVLAHVITAIVETYVSIDVISAVVPFTSGYRPFWVGLGTVAFDLLLAIMITGLLRPWLPAKVFRGVHWAVYAMWPIALLHGWQAASVDGDWVLLLDLGCLAAGLAAIVWRLVAARRRTAVVSGPGRLVPARVPVGSGRHP